MLCAPTIRDFGFGTLVGEANAEPPVSTGEVYSFILPNNGLEAPATTTTLFPAKPHPIGQGALPDIDARLTAMHTARGEDPGFDVARRDLARS
jgi:hypothetical protein